VKLNFEKPVRRASLTASQAQKRIRTGKKQYGLNTGFSLAFTMPSLPPSLKKT